MSEPSRAHGGLPTCGGGGSLVGLPGVLAGVRRHAVKAGPRFCDRFISRKLAGFVELGNPACACSRNFPHGRDKVVAGFGRADRSTGGRRSTGLFQAELIDRAVKWAEL